MSLSLSRWQTLWRRLELRGAAERPFRRLHRAHGQWWRAYHNAEHVADCLTRLDEVTDEFSDAINTPYLMEMAIWFHDAVYVPWLPNNEQRSAKWAERTLHKAGLDEASRAQVVELILATLHRGSPPPGDAQWMVDIDLSILGADEPRYAQYELEIRREYRWVRKKRFNAARKAILSSFLERSQLYETEYFRERLESKARRNLQRSLDQLEREGC